MTSLKGTLVPVLAAALALANVGADTAAQGRLRVGAELPPLRLPTVTGDEVLELSALRGQKLLLFQFASW